MQTLADLKRRMVPGTKIMMTEYTRTRDEEVVESIVLDNLHEKQDKPHVKRGIIGKAREVDEEQPYKSYWYISGSRLDVPKAKELTFDEDGEGFSVLNEWKASHGTGSLLLRYRFL